MSIALHPVSAFAIIDEDRNILVTTVAETDTGAKAKWLHLYRAGCDGIGVASDPLLIETLWRAHSAKVPCAACIVVTILPIGVTVASPSEYGR